MSPQDLTRRQFLTAASATSVAAVASRTLPSHADVVRKAGKLPAHKITQQYELEYGMAAIEMHSDAIAEGQRVLIHDDLLATGGSAEAAAKLILQAGGVVAGFSMLVELGFLHGASRLGAISGDIHSVVRY